MTAIGLMILIILVSFVFWRWMQALTGLDRALDPHIPVFEPDRRAVRTLFTTVEDSTGLNPDGSERQHLLQGCQAGQRLRLRAFQEEDANQARVEVSRRDGALLGHLEANAARDVADGIRSGFRVEAVIMGIYGSTRLRGTREVDLKLTRETAA